MGMAQSPDEYLTPKGEKRRDFLVLAAGAMGAMATVGVVWPIIETMNPSADVLAVASTQVDLKPVKVGQRITVQWRGKPVFIDHRTPKEIELAKEGDTADLPDPALDRDRVKREEWLIVIGVCTHLGCIPLGQNLGDPRGKYGGWYCPCHGSLYDTAGRVRRGPAPRNLFLPDYTFLDHDLVRIG